MKAFNSEKLLRHIQNNITMEENNVAEARNRAHIASARLDELKTLQSVLESQLKGNGDMVVHVPDESP